MTHYTKWILLCLCVWSSIETTSAQPKADDDSLLKATFIYKVSKFIRWPDKVDRSKLVLCTLGNDKLVSVFDIIAKNIDPKQTMIVQSIQDNTVVDNCHILYIASSEQGYYRSLDIITRNQALLTVSELPGFVQAGGMVELIYKDNRIRFDINLDTAHLSGLKISSNLLKLAHKIKWDNKP
jgi:hypothetical protein